MSALLLAACLSAADPPATVAGRTLDQYAAALNGETPTVRLRAVLSLRAFGADAVPAFVDALGHHDEAVRYRAASALGDLAGADGAGDAVPALRTLLTGGRGERLAAAYALSALGYAGEGLPVLTAALAGPGRAVPVAAADFLARLGPAAADAADALERATKHGDYHVANRAAQALAAVLGRDVIEYP